MASLTPTESSSSSASSKRRPSDSRNHPGKLEIDSKRANGNGYANKKLVSFRRESVDHRKGSIDVNEQSPLLAPRRSEDPGGLNLNGKVISPLSDDQWDPEDDGEETKSTWYMMLLTVAALGLQIAWSVEMSNGSPYLLSLGLSKSMLALVWIAGPLSGTLVQPYVGIKSDNCRISWGRRKPFIAGGAAATILSLMILAWTREIVSGVLGIFGADSKSYGVSVTTMCFAVLFVYVLDFAINVIQAAVRAFIVDCAPTHQQEDANAWVMRMSGLGNILGYLSGYANLAKILPWLGNSQFKVLCAIASFVLGLTAAISCLTIQERDPNHHGVPAERKDGVIEFFKSLWRSIRKLPPQITAVCQVQFFAWIGWFPFLFYITTYIGEIYTDPFFEENPHMSEEEINKLFEKATRIGTFALLIFALTTFTASVFLPFFIAPTYTPPAPPPRTPMTPTTPGSMSGSGYFNLKPPSRRSKKVRFQKVLDIVDNLKIESLTLRRAWFFSHLLFAFLMFLTFLVRSVALATTLVALVGIPWALTNWAPFALISAEISKRDAIRRGAIRPPPTRDGELLARGEDDTADQAGVVLGIHNVAIAAPQVIATIVSSGIFRALQKPRGSPGDDSVAWVLRFGGVCALVAAWWTLKVGEEKEEDK